MNENNKKIRRLCRLAYTLGQEGNYSWEEAEELIAKCTLAKSAGNKSPVPSENDEAVREAASSSYSQRQIAAFSFYLLGE